MKVRTTLAACLFTVTAAASAAAFPIAIPGTEGFPVIVTGTNDVIATYQGNSAAFSNDLFLEMTGTGPGLDGDLTNDVFIFNNHTSPVGSTVNLGSYALGTELVFRLHVNNTGIDFFTGPASRNPDNNFHARVQGNWMPGETLVSFEDLFDGPFNFNDLSFSFTNTSSTQVPEPVTLAMFGTGVAGLLLRRRRATRR